MEKYIMVIDDSVTIRKTIEVIIGDLGYKIMQAENGKDALDEIEIITGRGDEVILCLCDIYMPVMDGLTFLKEFRKKDSFTPVIAITTESDKKVIEQGRETGATGWIVKPFQPEELHNIVKRFIS